MNCQSAESLFSSYVEDEISQEERRNLESHLMGCRRCSLAMREIRATMSLLARIPEVEPSAHFDEDVYTRIRSGEGLRPSVSEWMRELLTPARLRPVFLAGAAVGAVAIALLVSPLGHGLWRSTVPSIAARPQGSGAGVLAQEPRSAPGTTAPASSTPIVADRTSSSQAPDSAPRERTNSVVASAQRTSAAEGDSIVDGRIERQHYTDEIINDQFYLERDRQGQNPAVVPVNETSGDGVFIIF